jgi:hypothetical protein
MWRTCWSRPRMPLGSPTDCWATFHDCTSLSLSGYGCLKDALSSITIMIVMPDLLTRLGRILRVRHSVKHLAIGGDERVGTMFE